jgi:DNA (cytosine-5)-methyltransferase 1
MKPRLLDLFCGAGGAAMGYVAAGFEVVGVDRALQFHYPFEFHHADALTFPLDGFDAIHASPPCQAFSLATHYHGTQADHADLVEPTRRLLEASGLPWVMENVERSPLRRDVVLCGEMFGLRVHRHRVFETGGFLVLRPSHVPHRLRGAKHNCHIEDGHARLVAGHFADLDDAGDAMGIDWMTKAELAQAIPPIFTEYVGGFLLAAVRARAAA